MIKNKNDLEKYLNFDKKALGIEKESLVFLEMKFGNMKLN